MNIKVFALLVVFCAVILVETDAGWFELPRIRFPSVRRIVDVIGPLCKPGCALGCDAGTSGLGVPICTYGCSNLCDGRRRRDTKNLLNGKTLIPLPHDFADYDLNRDGSITLAEFAEFLTADPANVEEGFNLADTNGDGTLNEAELLDAPWYFDDDADDDDDGAGTGEEPKGEDAG